MTFSEFIHNRDIRVLVIIVLALLGGIIATKFLRWLMDKSFVTASDTLNVDATRYRFVKNAVSFIIWVIVIGVVVSVIPSLKSLAVTLFAGAGILVAIVGFAAQQAFSNIISGIFIVMFKPFRVGDLIKVGTNSVGRVEDITLRHTVILNFENKRIIIPNSSISSDTIINENISDEKVCRYVEVGISYDSDLNLAMKILHDVALNHPLCIDVRTPEEKATNEPIVRVRLLRFGDSSMDLRAFVWTKSPVKAYQMHSDINVAIKKAFDENNIEIPFPHRTLVYKDGKK